MIKIFLRFILFIVIIALGGAVTCGANMVINAWSFPAWILEIIIVILWTAYFFVKQRTKNAKNILLIITFILLIFIALLIYYGPHSFDI